MPPADILAMAALRPLPGGHACHQVRLRLVHRQAVERVILEVRVQRGPAGTRVALGELRDVHVRVVSLIPSHASAHRRTGCLKA
jgi:hypothetical protein